MGKRQVFAVSGMGAEWKPVTDGANNDFEPAFSPDGRSLAFTSDRSGSPQIYLKELATGATRQITNEAPGASQPVWARDGSAIVYRGGALSGSNPSVEWGDSPESTILGFDLKTGYTLRFHDPLVANFEHPSVSARNTVVADQYNRIAEIDGNTGLRDIVQPSTTRIETPSVSFDGTLVAFGMMCEGGHESIWVTAFADTTSVCSQGRAVRYTPPGSAFARRPSFGPNGLVAFEQGTDQADIALAASPSAVVIAGGPSDERNPTWAPPGTVLP
jgi:Tol biopolymer transport system component